MIVLPKSIALLNCSTYAFKRHIHEDAVCLDPTVSAASVPNNVHQTESGSPVPRSVSENFSKAKEMIPAVVDTASEISKLDDVKHMEIDTTVLRASATEDNAGDSVPICKFSRKKYESVEIVTNLNQFTEGPFS